MPCSILSSTRLSLETLEDREVPAIMFALTNSQRLQTFDTSNPSILLGSTPIHGLASPGERLTDIDVRAANGGLYGRSDQGRVYLIDPTTGLSTQVGGAIAGASVGMAFDPTKDQLRAVNYSGGNIALNASTGAIAALGAAPTYVFGDVFQGTLARLSGLAFTNNGPLTLTTQLFGIDHTHDTLVRGIGDPNTGQMLTVGGLGVDITSNVGFDINPIGNVGFISIQPAGSPNSLFGQIDLNSGALSLFGTVGTSAPLLLDVAVADAFGTLGTGSAQPFLTTGTLFPTSGFFVPGQSNTSNTTGSSNQNSVPLTGDVLPSLSGFPNTSTFFPTTGTFFAPTSFVNSTGTFGSGSIFSNGLAQPLGPGIVGTPVNTFNSPLAPGIQATPTTFSSPFVSVPGVSSMDSFNNFDTFNGF
ncbi:MAG: DUF4394 domain-containing protein [Planctomycetes bacterium]|nr:DUF4394 domain-containing protein [Planctomycetota bacterium]